jgi:nitroimidazol reductase NimA-like FMN-containing flavoprotein (pyridoxamine 5'-phosphate oxidase superfamily)
MEQFEGGLTPAECWSLLSGETVGRVALSIRALPAILPVRYAIDGRSVRIHLESPGLSPVSVQDAVVAFAVDEIDNRTGAGWTVQVQGRVRMVPGPPPLDGTGSGDVGPMGTLEPGTVTGHRFTLHPSAVIF